MATKKQTECNATEHNFQLAGSNILVVELGGSTKNPPKTLKNAEIILFCANCGKLKYVEAHIERITLS